MTYLLNYHIDWLLGCKPITCTDALRRGSLGYLNHKALTDKDDGLSLGSQEEFQIAICLVFEEMQKMIFEDVLIFFWHMTFFTGPTDDSGRYPTKNSKGCESFVCHRDERVIRVMRQIQCFIRLGMNISDLTEFIMYKLGR